MEPEEIFRLSFFLLLFAFLGIRAYYGRKSTWTKRTRKERKEDLELEGKGSAILLLVMWVFYMVWSFLYIVGFPGIEWSFFTLNVEWRIIGLIESILAVLYIWWAQKTLGSHFTATITILDGATLVTEGPYARVRHPIYSANTLFNSAVVLITTTWIFLILLLIGIPWTYERMFKEEEKMIEQFGEKYEIYMGKTGRIFPRFRQ